MARSNEPMSWSLFSAGGMVAAFLMPITIFITGMAIPLELLSVSDIWKVMDHWMTKLYLFGLISLSLAHWAHRFRYAAADLGLKSLGAALPILCYGSALVGTGFAGYLIVSM